MISSVRLSYARQAISHMQICHMLYMCGQTPRQMRAEIILQHMKSKPNERWVHEPLPEDELPLKWSQAAPCMGKRVATLHVTASGDSELKLIWSGNTWAIF